MNNIKPETPTPIAGDSSALRTYYDHAFRVETFLVFERESDLVPRPLASVSGQQYCRDRRSANTDVAIRYRAFVDNELPLSVHVQTTPAVGGHRAERRRSAIRRTPALVSEYGTDARQ